MNICRKVCLQPLEIDFCNIIETFLLLTGQRSFNVGNAVRIKKIIVTQDFVSIKEAVRLWGCGVRPTTLKR
ncbi:unnamed protein product [Hermetia illucens]|uniref:Uncharacterized protein n=1 Tax=Hermetia illucens TaxID=343691 RepID=A0A7R8Z1T9_HERIL|nr:unnamed protein product [Hermetia illucens]